MNRIPSSSSSARPIYLIFSEGYATTSGEMLVRVDVCAEAIRLGRTVRTLLSPHPPPEVTGLVPLMLLHDARRGAHLDESGDRGRALPCDPG